MVIGGDQVLGLVNDSEWCGTDDGEWNSYSGGDV